MLELRQSQISMLLRCPKQWELRYVLGIKPPTFSYLFLGSACHFAIAENYRYKMTRQADMPIEQVLATYSDSWDKRTCMEKSDNTEIVWEEPEGQTKDVGAILIKKYHKDIAPKTEPLAVEIPFAKEVGGIILTSRIDLITPTCIVDHKTGKRRRSQDEIDRDIQPTVHFIVSNTPPSTYQYHMLVKVKDPYCIVLDTKRTPGDVSFFLNQILPSAVKMVQSGLFPPLGALTWLCNPAYCAYFPMCRG